MTSSMRSLGVAMPSVRVRTPESSVRVGLVAQSLLSNSVVDALAAPDLAIRPVDPRSADEFAAVAATRPDVLVIDVTDGRSALLTELASTASSVDTRVLALTDPDDDDGVLAAFAYGADACLPVSASLADLEHTIRALATGACTVDQAHLNELISRTMTTDVSTATVRTNAPGLTKREAEVLQLLVEGATTKQIAEVFGISHVTVRSHVQKILGKLGVHSRLEAVAWALARDE